MLGPGVMSYSYDMWLLATDLKTCVLGCMIYIFWSYDISAISKVSLIKVNICPAFL